jgi:hypothetical protein
VILKPVGFTIKIISIGTIIARLAALDLILAVPYCRQFYSEATNTI